MQPQFILATLLAGFAAAIVHGDQPVDDAPQVYCEQGQGSPIPGPRGTFCIGVKGENFGLAKECLVAACLRIPGCESVRDDNGCRVCPPGC